MSLVRVAMVMAILASIGWQGLFRSAEGAQQGFQPASHQDGPQVHYLFGSGSRTGGKPITLRVELTGPAPSGGADIVLTSDQPSIIPLPATVSVPAGESELTFKADTNPVSADIHVRVSAGYGGVTKGREVLIKDPDLRSLSVQSVIRGGGQGKITVCLTGAAASGGVTVNLTSGATPTGIIIVEPILDVPATVTIPAGKGCLSIIVGAAEVTEDTPVTVYASYRGVNLSQNAIVRDFPGPPPPTATATETAIPAPVFSFTVLSGVPVESGGTVVFDVCLVSGSEIPYTVTFDSSAMLKASAGTDPATFETVGECEEGTLTDIAGGGSTGGQVRLQAVIASTVVGESENISFPDDPATATPTETATDVPTETPTNTPEPTATNTAEPTATSTEVASTAVLSLTRNEIVGSNNEFSIAGSGFLPNAPITLRFQTDSGYDVTFTDYTTTDALGEFSVALLTWPCGGSYGTSDLMTATDGTNTDTETQPILC